MFRLVRVVQGRTSEGGGLVIDYTAKGGSDVRRIKLAFTEIGMWRHPLPSPDE